MRHLLRLPVFVLALAICHSTLAQQHPTLGIGSAAPNFSLPGIDGKTYTLNSFKKSKVLVIVFMCNHCPTSQAYEQRIIKFTNEYKAKGVSVVGINPNNPASLRLDELGYSDVGDSFDDMIVRAKDKHFNFPYLYDGETEVTSIKYGPVSTPHVFIFDEARKLRYQGRFDDMENPSKTPHSLDTYNATEALLNNLPVPVETTKVFGCSIKWAEKKDWLEKAAIKWAKEPVNLAIADGDSIKGVLQNSSGKLRLVQLWGTRNEVSMNEFTDLVMMHRMYRDRGFELVTISLNNETDKDSVLAFLRKQQASGPNYLFTETNKTELAKAINPEWNGALPYTMLIEPGGKIVYAKQGAFKTEEMKNQIFYNHLIGRIYN